VKNVNVKKRLTVSFSVILINHFMLIIILGQKSPEPKPELLYPNYEASRLRLRNTVKKGNYSKRKILEGCEVN
jgi:hypothetical protein